MLTRTAKVTVKGQVTLPKEVREHLETKDGDAVSFEVADGHATLRRVKPVDLRDFFGVLSGGAPFAGRGRERAAAQRHVSSRATNVAQEQ